MKSLSMSLALAVSLGLSSAALADGGCGAPKDPCSSGHGLLSKLRLPTGCGGGGGHDLFGRIKGMLHRDCCGAEKAAAPAKCGGCGHSLFSGLKGAFHCGAKADRDPCGGHWFSGIGSKLHSLLGPCCSPCGGAAPAKTTAPAPAPTPMGADAGSNGLLILNPAG